jgi:hypothetical protein
MVITGQEASRALGVQRLIASCLNPACRHTALIEGQMRSFHRANSPNPEQEGKPGEPAMRVIRKYLGLQGPTSTKAIFCDD